MVRLAVSFIERTLWAPAGLVREVLVLCPVGFCPPAMPRVNMSPCSVTKASASAGVSIQTDGRSLARARGPALFLIVSDVNKRQRSLPILISAYLFISDTRSFMFFHLLLFRPWSWTRSRQTNTQTRRQPSSPRQPHSVHAERKGRVCSSGRPWPEEDWSKDRSTPAGNTRTINTVCVSAKCQANGTLDHKSSLR